MKSITIHVSINAKKIINNKDENKQEGKDLVKPKLAKKVQLKEKVSYLGKMIRTSIRLEAN